MKLSRYLKVFPSPDRPGHVLLYSTLRSSIAAIPAETLAALQEGVLPDDGCEALRRLGMLIEDPDAEREQMRELIARANGRTRHFKASVVLNLDCNLDCGYCFEGEFRCGQYMSDATADLLVEKLVRDRISQGWDVTVTFYGGEPLLSQDLIRGISQRLREAARSHGVKYAFNLVTNGTLLDRNTALQLLPLGLQGAKFTVDGPPEIHDAQRPYASGAGSFDIIVGNLAQVCDLVSIQLGANYRPENYREFPRLLDLLPRYGITPDKLAAVMFTPVVSTGGCSDLSSGCALSEEPWLMEAVPFLREATLARGYRAPTLKPSACIVELEDNLVIDCTGKFYKCPAFMGWEGMSVGSLDEGLQDYRVSHGIGNWQVDACLDCSYLPLCFGGCRFVSKLQGNSLTEVDCRRTFYDATLEKSVLQNLTYLAPRKKATAQSTFVQAAAPPY
ncbi:geopeptide radical SAM maturase [Geomonas subterranea]|uniref:Geopeptide radical SAM maturase n=1 Tax=Geomonas subterranea TaxID=2847989 RepID=A0ABX8LJ96_9BACT|nr:geopeptide radical SAM maturase [Geomonas subterranea]QXE91772.1 geopeptide radical SAM maturase [Geomonas subterranea]QXM10135.1 geopeptide radical SAM maturase [Geomonas subterranea]